MKNITIEREYPALSYEVVENNLKHVLGQVLTIVEALGVSDNQAKATKSLIKDRFNDKMTFLFDMYGRDTDLECPNYSYNDGKPE